MEEEIIDVTTFQDAANGEEKYIKENKTDNVKINIKTKNMKEVGQGIEEIAKALNTIPQH